MTNIVYSIMDEPNHNLAQLRFNQSIIEYTHSFFAARNCEDDIEQIIQDNFKDDIVHSYSYHNEHHKSYYVVTGDWECLFGVGFNNVSATFGFNDLSVKDECANLFDRLFKEPEYKTETSVPVNFWYNSGNGPAKTTKKIEVPKWDEVKDNYAPHLSEALQRIHEIEDGSKIPDGQLLLWQGNPGTGKTYALRSLCKSWQDWCEFHYITDPDQFFGHASYMLKVCFGSSDPYDYEDSGEEKWKLLILEDSGELLRHDARTQVGQAISRFLNVVDGMIGQGLKLMILVTTNEELGDLHPAVSRPGRAVQQLSFGNFKPSEAEEWIKKQTGEKRSIRSTKSLAELYQEISDSDRDVIKANAGKVGFA